MVASFLASLLCRGGGGGEGGEGGVRCQYVALAVAVVVWGVSTRIN